jgi:hypothetical protein
MELLPQRLRSSHLQKVGKSEVMCRSDGHKCLEYQLGRMEGERTTKRHWGHTSLVPDRNKVRLKRGQDQVAQALVGHTSRVALHSYQVMGSEASERFYVWLLCVFFFKSSGCCHGES